MKNKKGFTLIELLGVIIILAILLLIAIPSITRLTETTKKTQYIVDAKKMVTLVTSEIKSGNINKPAAGELVKVTLKDLKTQEIEKDKDGYYYDLDNSYVYIVRKDNNIEYYVQLLGDKSAKSKHKYRGILLVKAEELEDKNNFEKYYENIDELVEVTPIEIDSGIYKVGIVGKNVSVGEESIEVGYNKNVDIEIMPNEGYHLSDVECINGYTTNAMIGESYTNRQIVTISNNKVNGGSRCRFIGGKNTYSLVLNLIKTTTEEGNLTIKYDDSKRIDINPEEGYYLASVGCNEGYEVEAETGIEATGKQIISIKNKKVKISATCSLISLPTYPRVTGGSDTWSREGKEYEIMNPKPTSQVARYEYYVSESNEKPGREEEATGSFTQDKITVNEKGKYVYFRVIYASGVISEWSNAKDLYLDNGIIEAPEVIGGGNELTLSKIYMLIAPETTSGIKKYEYYISDANTLVGNEEPTGEFTNTVVNINTKGTYIYFRSVNNLDERSVWSEAKELYVDPNTYIITYNFEGGETEEELILDYNVETEEFNLPTPTRSGYTFGGWYLDSEYNGEEITQQVKGSQGDKNYYAKWVPITYTITYNLNGGTQEENAKTEYNIETDEFELPTPTRNGYEFKGWYENIDLSGEKIEKIEKGTQGNKILYAKWEIITYIITYHTNTGIENVLSMIPYTVETDDFNLATPSKSGYTFGGWYENIDLSGAATTTILKGTTGNKDYYAKWGINAYEVIMLGNNITFGQDTVNVDYENANTVTIMPDDGYYVTGWSCTNDYTITGMVVGDPLGMVETPIEFFAAEQQTITINNNGQLQGATCTINTYTIDYTLTYNLNNGNMPVGVSNPETYKIDTTTFTLNNPIMKGYTFTGWTGSNGNIAEKTVTIEKGTTGNKTYNANYTPLSITVTLNQQNGSGGTESVTATYDSNMPSATAPTRSGYTFGGYYTETEGNGTKYYSSSMASSKKWDKDEATTLYAKWIPILYNVTLDKQGGSGGTSSVTATYGSAMPDGINAPTRTGYIFEGYYTEPEGNGTKYYSSSMQSVRDWSVASDTTLYAKWTEIQTQEP